MKIRVRQGDSFWLYSQLFKIPIQLIEDANENISPTSLQIGQEINIPGFVTDKYSIQRGDSLWRLARARNLSLDTLLLVNQNVNPYNLQVNQIIRLPRRIQSPIVNGNQEYDFYKMEADLNRLKEIYPFLKIRVIGESVLGLPLYEIEVGRGNRNIHFNSSFHANEWITTPVLMQLLNEYVLSLVNGYPIRGVYTLPLYNRNRLSIVPMVNPDGVNLVLNGPQPEKREELIVMNNGSEDFSGWKANIRGVDLNNQFPANWEIEKERKEPKAPAPRDFPGDAPLTEPEAIAMANLAKKQQFSRMLAFHTQVVNFIGDMKVTNRQNQKY